MSVNLSIFETTVIPAMIFVIWIFVQMGIPKKFAPIIALALGITAGLYFVGFTAEGIVVGVLLAAAAIGFHSGTKNVIEGGTNSVRKP